MHGLNQGRRTCWIATLKRTSWQVWDLDSRSSWCKCCNVSPDFLMSRLWCRDCLALNGTLAPKASPKILWFYTAAWCFIYHPTNITSLKEAVYRAWIFPVISAFYRTPVALNAEITRKIPSSGYTLNQSWLCWPGPGWYILRSVQLTATAILFDNTIHAYATCFVSPIFSDDAELDLFAWANQPAYATYFCAFEDVYIIPA